MEVSVIELLISGLCLQMGLLLNLEAILSELFVMKFTVGASFGDVIFCLILCVVSHHNCVDTVTHLSVLVMTS